MKLYKTDFVKKVGVYAIIFIARLIFKTVKINYDNYDAAEKLIKENKNFTAAFWHGTMMAPWKIFSDKNFSALVSKSKDGEMLTKLLKRWKYKVARGSSADGGGEALKKMIELAAAGMSVAITPDGPKGPPHVFKPGAVITAKKTGMPLVLIGVGYSRKWIFKSWDKFEFPKFFCRINLCFSDPIYINNDLSYEATSNKISECELELNKLQQKANSIL